MYRRVCVIVFNNRLLLIHQDTLGDRSQKELVFSSCFYLKTKLPYILIEK